MRTAVIGLGVTGMSCLRHLARQDELVVVDTRRRPPGLAEATAAYPAAQYRLGTDRFDPAGIDRAILSPGIAPKSPLGRQVLHSGLPVLSDIDLFFAQVHEPIFAVTGTNGKSTVTALVGHLLAARGLRPGVGGNLGLAALDLIAPDRDCYVLELSSFQLERLRGARCRAATVLNLSGDHLDRHGSMDCYAAAKQRIYRGAERAVANRHEPLTRPMRSTAAELVTFGRDEPAPGHWGVRVRDGNRALACGDRAIVDTRRLPVAGSHHEQNILAALAMVHGADFDGDEDAVATAIAGFAGLPHRCETVAVIDAVTYVNDSKATNVGATLAALSGLAAGPGSIVLIAGGDGKGADFTELGDAIARRARHLVVLGADGPVIERATRGRVPVSRALDLGEAVQKAAAAAAPGDTLLFSPACASFDMFENFAARGESFRAAVEHLGS